MFLFILLVNFNYVFNKVQYSDSFIAFYDGQVDEKNFKHLEEYGYVFDKKVVLRINSFNTNSPTMLCFYIIVYSIPNLKNICN